MTAKKQPAKKAAKETEGVNVKTVRDGKTLYIGEMFTKGGMKYSVRADREGAKVFTPEEAEEFVDNNGPDFEIAD